MLEYLGWLLLPLAVYSGWWSAKNYDRSLTRKKNRNFNDQYFQGLNYLLNEQPDKAIQVFLELAEVNQDTVETHLALGSLSGVAAKSIAPFVFTRISLPKRICGLSNAPRLCWSWAKTICVPACWIELNCCFPS